MKKSFLPVIIIFCVFTYTFIHLLSSDKKPPPNELLNEAYIRFIKTQSGKWNDTFTQPIFQNKSAPMPIKMAIENQPVLSASTINTEKWI